MSECHQMSSLLLSFDGDMSLAKVSDDFSNIAKVP